MITVFGASGHTGGAAAAHLVKQGKRVRVVGRHRARLATLEEAGAEAWVGDMEDAGFVRRALRGADAAYLLIPPNLAADDFRRYQRRVTESLSRGVEEAEVGHVVLLSSIGAQHRQGTGPIVGVHEFEQRLARIESLDALFLRAGYFMENLFMGATSVRNLGVHADPLPPEATMAMIASADIGVYAGRRLERLDFRGKSVVHLVGPQTLSQAEIARILGQAVGKPVRYAQVPFEVVERGMLEGGLPPSVVSSFMEMYRGAAAGLVAPEDDGLVEHAPTTFETFAKSAFAAAPSQ
jgi:uncharacterized protein YbjT (DUF2867 family)